MGFLGQVAKPREEALPVLIVVHDAATFDAPHDHVLQGSGRIKTGASRHRRLLHSGGSKRL
jgi:hypothetical protein